jgi:tetratricopeptide (TPR) repeat protein
LCLLVFNLNGQENIDSIEANLAERDLDTNLINDYLLLANHFRLDDSLKTITYIDKAIQISSELKNNLKKGEAFLIKGKFHVIWGYDLEKAATNYKIALDLFRAENKLDKELEMILRLGACYDILGQDEESFAIYEEGLLRHPDNPSFSCVINNDLAGKMKSIGEGEKAISYYDISDKNFQLIKNPVQIEIDAQLSNDKNRGVIYRNFEIYDTAEFYFNRSLDRSIELGDSAWIARNYNSIGIMYERQNLFLQAIEMFEKSLAIKKSLKYTDGVVTTLTNIGNLYFEIGNTNKALKYIEEADGLCGMDCEPGRQSRVLRHISHLYYETGNHKLAYEKLNRHVILQDSLDEVYSTKQSLELEAKYQNNMHQVEQDKLEAELVASDLREQNRNAQLKTQRNLLILGTVLGIILFGLVIISIRSNIKRKAANKALQEKNDEVIQKSDKIEQQKHQIEIKNQEMLDSITYAKRIQDAILPNDIFFKKQLPDSFIYYQPKDILAGDFYWMDVIGDTVIWAAADCTGHGIPGAMVSVVCHNALNRSVHEFGFLEPGKILDCTRDLVIKSFEKSGMDVKDGMDIALCCWNKKTKKLQFSGANNPLWILRNSEQAEVTETDFKSEDGAIVLKEIKGDKQPVGRFYHEDPFTTVDVELKEEDQLFVFTDGFADQFGGDKGKKLKYKNFKKLILQNSMKNLDDHGKEMEIIFNQWKGDFEQLDDVCVIGVKF